MVDPPRYRPGSEDLHTTPRWVKLFGIVVLVVVLLLFVLLLTRGPGGHGPQRHFSLGEGAAVAPLSGTILHTFSDPALG